MPPTADGTIRESLTKVLTSPEFQNSDRLCRFLRFIVEARLRGEQDQVKEYLIGKEVFDRDSNYDPRLDPIVRVEARRLRKKLDAYYAGPGAVDPVRFELPKGAYIPEIREPAPVPAAATPKPRTRFQLASILVLVCAAVAAAAYYWTRPPAATGQVLAIVPARWLWAGNEFPDIPHDEDLPSASPPIWPRAAAVSGGGVASNPAIPGNIDVDEAAIP